MVEGTVGGSIAAKGKLWVPPSTVPPNDAKVTASLRKSFWDFAVWVYESSP